MEGLAWVFPVVIYAAVVMISLSIGCGKGRLGLQCARKIISTRHSMKNYSMTDIEPRK